MKDYKNISYSINNSIVDKVFLTLTGIVLTSVTLYLAVQEINKYFGF